MTGCERTRRIRVAYVHVLPLEDYPPARNTVKYFAGRPNFDVRVWTSPGNRGDIDWRVASVQINRHAFPKSGQTIPTRMVGYLRWHLRVAAELALWKPDVLFYIEPHSALAVGIFYRLLRGRASLLIHHHEYYAPVDYNKPGARLLRATRRLESEYLIPRAIWVSQTNSDRLRLLRTHTPGIRPGTSHVLPNYPPREWLMAASSTARVPADDRLRLVYVGSASLEDTFIAEAATWCKENSKSVCLHVCGNNIRENVWQSLRALNAPNISLQPEGCNYDNLPELLRSFDAGLILYRGNTQNFVYNVPNKAIEYLGAGLEVWYPPEMISMRSFAESHPELPLREVDFSGRPPVPIRFMQFDPRVLIPEFTSQRVLGDLVDMIETTTDSMQLDSTCENG